jgi:predicted MFS family arabinose efflux permease
MVPAAFGVIAKDFGVSHQQASYLTTSYTLLGGVTPLLLTPYVNLYGRRPAYLVWSLKQALSLVVSDYLRRSSLFLLLVQMSGLDMLPLTLEKS